MPEEKPQPQSDNSSSLKVLRTYKDDLAQVMSEQNTSVVSAATAENEKRLKKTSKKNTPEQKKRLKKIGIIILSTTLIVLGAGSVLYFYGKSDSGVVTPEAKISSIIFAEEEKEFDITDLSRRQILNELSTLNNESRVTLGSIENIFITESFIDSEGLQKRSLVDAEDFLNAINTDAPASFLRSLNPRFMVGVHVFDGNQPFIILQTSFYENAFAGMLKWERYIKDDLAPLFGPIDVTPIVRTDDSSKINTLTFGDIVIKNQDTRVLRNEDGDIVLLYSFIDKNTIVITTNQHTFEEVFIRHTSSRFK